MNRKITVPVTDWTVEGKSIPIGYEGEMNRQTIIFDFDEELTAAAYTIEIKGYTKGFRFLHKDGNKLWMIVDKDMTKADFVGAVDLQIKAYVDGEMIAKSNIFSGRVYESINAETEIPEAEISAFDRALLDYNEKLQQAITAAVEASSAKDEAISARDSTKELAESASASATDAQLSAQLADTYQTMANNAAVNSIENAGKAEDAADSAERLAELARSAMTIAQTSAEDAVRARDAAVQAKTDTVGYADNASASALAAKNADAGATMAANTAYASQRDAESASQSAQRSAQSASQSAQEAVASASSAAGSASAATNSAATAEEKASEASASAAQAETAKTSTENLLDDAREGLHAKLDKPVDAPSIGSLARVKDVNPDGTFVMEWVEDKQDKIESDLAWETGRVDDAYDILDGVGYDKVEMAGEAYAVDIPDKVVGKAEVTEIGGKTVVWNQYYRLVGDSTTSHGVITTKNQDGSINIHGTTNTGGDYGQVAIGGAFKIERDGSVMLFSTNKPIDHKIGITGYPSMTIPGIWTTPIATISWSGLPFLYVPKESVSIDIDNLVVCIVNLTKIFGAGNEPTSVNDHRIKLIEQYTAEHPEYNEGELISAMVEAVTSTKPDETVIESRQIPDTVKSLPGYGWSAGTAKNYIYRYNGRWMYRQEVDKRVLNGSETWRTQSITTSGIGLFLGVSSWEAKPLMSLITDSPVLSVGRSGQSASKSNVISFDDVGVNLLINIDLPGVTDDATFSNYLSQRNLTIYYEFKKPIITDITDLMPTHFGELDIEAGGSVTFENEAMLEVPYKMDILEKRSVVRDVQVAGESKVVDGVGSIPISSNTVLGVSKIAGGMGLDIAKDGAVYIKDGTTSRVDNRNNSWAAPYLPITANILDYAVLSAMADGKGPEWTDENKLLARQRLNSEEYQGEHELIETYVVQEGGESNIKISLPGLKRCKIVIEAEVGDNVSFLVYVGANEANRYAAENYYSVYFYVPNPITVRKKVSVLYVRPDCGAWRGTFSLYDGSALNGSTNNSVYAGVNEPLGSAATSILMSKNMPDYKIYNRLHGLNIIAYTGSKTIPEGTKIHIIGVR